LFPSSPPQDVNFYAALASKRAQGNQDAIDFCITQVRARARAAVAVSCPLRRAQYVAAVPSRLSHLPAAVFPTAPISPPAAGAHAR